MKRTVLLGTLLAAVLVPFSLAHATSNVAVSVSTPEFGIRIGAPVYRPVPFYAPVPVYAPAPVYAPLPVYVPAPRVIYPAPVAVLPARGYYGAPAGVWVAPRGYGHHHWKHRHDDRRGHRRDRYEYRAGYGY